MRLLTLIFPPLNRLPGADGRRGSLSRVLRPTSSNQVSPPQESLVNRLGPATPMPESRSIERLASAQTMSASVNPTLRAQDIAHSGTTSHPDICLGKLEPVCLIEGLALWSCPRCGSKEMRY